MKERLIEIIDGTIIKLCLFFLISFLIFIILIIVFEMVNLAEKSNLGGNQIVIITGAIAGVIGFIIVVLWREKRQPNR